jgi:hypothetical protein
MYDIKVYWGKDGQSKAQRVTATYVRWQNWSGRHRNMATNCTCTISFLPLNYLMSYQETDLLLRYCQTKQNRHATTPSTEHNSEKGRHSHKNHGWLDGNTVAGLHRHMHADEYSQCHSETSQLQWGRKSPIPVNCDGLKPSYGLCG